MGDGGTLAIESTVKHKADIEDKDGILGYHIFQSRKLAPRRTWPLYPFFRFVRSHISTVDIHTIASLLSSLP